MNHPWFVARRQILEEECSKSLSTFDVSYSDSFCNATTDVFGGCWNYTAAGETQTIDCPPLLSLSAPKGFARRQCLTNGTWALADYRCTFVAKDYHPLPLYIFNTGYSVSIAFLTISLAIFFGFRQLRCGRVTVHKNLFLSYIFTGITWICYNSLVALKGEVLLENPIWCQCLHVAAQYFIVCNFSWMFCEGLYLHTILLKAFSTGKSLLIVCSCIGWVFPLFPTAAYAAARGHIGDTSQCWIGESTLQWIMFGPIVISLFVNICFLINIVRLLMTKLRQIPDAPQTKKAARATLVLIPLLGIQYLLMPMRPDKGSNLMDAYQYISAIAVSLQGAFVSIIYCFCNGEVVSIFKRRWSQHLMMRGNNTSHCGRMTTTTYTVTEACPRGDEQFNDEKVNQETVPLNDLSAPDF